MRRYAALYLGLCHAWGWPPPTTRDCGPLSGRCLAACGTKTAGCAGRRLHRKEAIPMDGLLENTVLLHLVDYRRMVEELTLLRLRCEKQAEQIEKLEKGSAACAGKRAGR